MPRVHGRQAHGHGRLRHVDILDLPPLNPSGRALGNESSSVSVASGRTLDSMGIESTASVASFASIDSQLTAKISNTTTTGSANIRSRSSLTTHTQNPARTTARSRAEVPTRGVDSRHKGKPPLSLSRALPDTQQRPFSASPEDVVVAAVMAELEAELVAEENASRQEQSKQVRGTKPVEILHSDPDVCEGPDSNDSSSLAFPIPSISQLKDSKEPAREFHEESSMPTPTIEEAYQEAHDEEEHAIASSSRYVTRNHEVHPENDHDDSDGCENGSRDSGLDTRLDNVARRGAGSELVSKDSETRSEESRRSRMPNEAKIMNKDVEAAEALFKMGLMEMESGNLGAAGHCLEQSLIMNQSTLGLDHPMVGDIQHTLGLVQIEYGKYETACMTLWDAQRIRKLNLDLVGAADSLQEIGKVHLAGGRTELALDCFGECLRVRRAELGDHDLKVAFTYIDLGNVESDLGRKEDACDHFKNGKTACYHEIA